MSPFSGERMGRSCWKVLKGRHGLGLITGANSQEGMDLLPLDLSLEVELAFSLPVGMLPCREGDTSLVAVSKEVSIAFLEDKISRHLFCCESKMPSWNRGWLCTIKSWKFLLGPVPFEFWQWAGSLEQFSERGLLPLLCVLPAGRF